MAGKETEKLASSLLEILYRTMGLVKVIPIEERGAILCDINGRNYPVELGLRTPINFDDLCNALSEGFVFQDKIRSAVRVGNLVIADKICFKNNPPPRIPEFHILGMNSPLPRTTVGRGYLPHFAVSAAAIQGEWEKIKEKTILDLGAGEASLSMAALAYGGKRAILVEKEKSAVLKAWLNLFYNDLSQKCEILEDDIWNLSGENYTEMLNPVEVVIANIGPQEIYGGQEGTHLAVASLLPYLSHAETLILGGYGPDNSDLGPERIIQALSPLGFNLSTRYQIKEKDGGENTGAQTLVFTRS